MIVLPDPIVLSTPMWELGTSTGLGTAIETATGWGGLILVFVYSFLVAFALPGPSELVLAAPLDLGLPRRTVLGCIILISAIGKAFGSLFAFRLSQRVTRASPITRRLRRSRFDVLERIERRTFALLRRYGYAGLAVVLCIPLFPDTIPIYAFAALGGDSLKFALAAFVGSLGRLLVTLGLVSGVLAVV